MKTWDDLLFEYVTGTLAPTDYNLFRQMLDQDPARRADLEAMQRLKANVRAEADTRVRDLPPLSIHSELNAVGRIPIDPLADLSGQQTQSMPPVRQRRAVWTVAVAAAMVLLVGAVLFFVQRDDGESQTATMLDMESPTLPVQISATHTPTPYRVPASSPTYTSIPPPINSISSPMPQNPLMSITPSMNSPIVSAPASLIATGTMPGGDAALSCHWLPDDTLVVQGFSGAWLYDNADFNAGVRLLPAGTDGFVDVAVSPDGQSIVTLGWDRELILWDAVTGQQVARTGSNQLWDRLTTNADASVIISRLERGVSRVITDGPRTFREGESMPYDYAYHTYLSPNGDVLALVHTTADELQFVDFATGEQLATADTSGVGNPRSAAFSPDGSLFVVGRDDGVLRVFDVATGKLAGDITHGGRAASVIFNADNTLVAAVIENRPLYTLRVWNLQDGAVYTTVTFDQQMGKPAFNAAGDQLAVGTPDGRVVIVDVSALR